MNLLFLGKKKKPQVAQVAGPNSATAGADDNAVGAIAWTNPGNISASDDSYATATGSNNAISHFLKATNFAFTIPNGATINGIKVEIEMGLPDALTCQVSRVSIVKGGVIGATNRKADASLNIGNVDGYKVYGGAAELWGDTWTAADINSANFGVALSVALDIGFDGAQQVGVDHVRITVYYAA
jgi:hypothetical protein